MYFLVEHNDSSTKVEVVNYHYKGACLHVEDDLLLRSLRPENTKLDFYIGTNLIKGSIPYRIAWHDSNSNHVGIEFDSSVANDIAQFERVPTLQSSKPSLTCMDPYHPDRLINFEVVNLSKSGFLVSTSLSNRFLMPGTRLTECKLIFPGIGECQLSTQIKITKESDDASTFQLGLNIEDGDKEGYQKLYNNYLIRFHLESSNIEEDLIESAIPKKIKQGITFKEIKNEEGYKQVLNLRYNALEAKKKKGERKTAEAMGQGLETEGLIIGGYLGAKLISAMELRFGNEGDTFRMFDYINPEMIRGHFHPKKSLEVSNLVIDPLFQGTDVVLGMVQKVCALAGANGELNITLSATSSLSRFYTKAGAKNTKISYPHPNLANEHLTIHYFTKEIYSNGNGVNPYSWNMVFSAVNSYLANYGYDRKRKLKIHEKLYSNLTKKVLLSKKKRKKVPAKKEKARVSLKDQQYIDPSLTEQDFHAAGVMYPYILAADEMIGKMEVDLLLEKIGITREYISNRSNWVSVKLLDELLEGLPSHISRNEVSKRSGEIAMQRDTLGPKYHILKFFVSPEMLFKSFENVFSKFNKTRHVKLEEIRSGYIRLALLQPFPGKLPKHHSSCQNIISNTKGYLRLVTGDSGSLEKISCCYDGHSACRYEVKWKSSKFKGFKKPLILTSAVSATAFGLVQAGLQPQLSALATVAVGLALTSIYFFLKSSKGNRELKAFQEEAFHLEEEQSTRYKDLQNAKDTLNKRYHESSLMADSILQVQKSHGIKETLDTTLELICQKFEFARAILMLKTDDNLLEPVSIKGVDVPEPIWNFKVKVDQERENPLVLSSVYHSGNSVLISDVQEHLFQLNEQSRKLLRLFDVNSFIIVAIPSQDGSWGVLLVDRKDKPVDFNDLKLIERIAMPLGLGLDKEAQISRERDVRKIFQKYVPQEIVDTVLDEKAHTLGGQTKDIACFFLDIRDFTRTTRDLPAQKTVELLNIFFSRCETIIQNLGGIIDKFLGDGFMAMWGATGNNVEKENLSVRAAMEIIDELTIINVELKRNGLPEIRIGIGIDEGAAIVGNIGSENRMDYTCIGNVVNMASRLESLTKELNSTLIISDKLYNNLELETRNFFTRQDGVSVKGIEKEISVYCIENAERKREVA